jgi:hypothetical protein
VRLGGKLDAPVEAKSVFTVFMVVVLCVVVVMMAAVVVVVVVVVAVVGFGVYRTLLNMYPHHSPDRTTVSIAGPSGDPAA